MKKQFYFFNLLFLFYCLTSFSQVKIGDNPTIIGTSSALELESTNKALLITRVPNTASIVSPVNGMLIFDISSNCIKGYQNGSWTNCIGTNSTSNGTAVVSAYSCSGNSVGTLIAGTLISGVTQTITATVITVGTYSISTTANGVTYSASGTFYDTGNQQVTLTAAGTPALAGDTLFTLNTTPNCNFSRPIIDRSTNGTGVVSVYTCNTNSSGNLYVANPAFSVSQTITATVTALGTYNISNTVNGVTFAAAGVFTTLGSQSIVLTATGIPLSLGSTSFNLNTTPSCSFIRTVIHRSTNGTGIVSAYTCGALSGTLTNQIPLSGVSKTITATVTALGTYNISCTFNGITFAASGNFTSLGSQTIVLVATGTPIASGSFNGLGQNTNPNCTFSLNVLDISTNGTAISSSYLCNTASGGTMIAGNVISGGMGVTQTITATPTIGTYNISATANGVTFSGIGLTSGAASEPITLTATGTPIVPGNFLYTLNTTPSCSFTRTVIHSSTNGTGVVSQYTSDAGTGTIISGTVVSGVSQSIIATVTTLGTYSISATANGVTFTASGTFTTLGSQQITLTATGTPTVASNTLFTLNTTPNCSFTRTVIDTSTNGTAIVSGYSCNIGSTGSMVAGIPVSGVTQTITATVTIAGTYNITTTSNGVTFTGSGTFTGTGSRQITLTATGTPIVSGTFSFTLNTTPNCNFSRIILQPLPTGVTLGTANPYFVANANDSDYLPYTTPVGPATLATVVMADGIADTTINFSTLLSSTGVVIKIPYTASIPVTLPAFSQTINIPSTYLESGGSKNVVFSYPSTSLLAGSGTIDATLRASSFSINPIKLDINTGIGSDNLGWLLANFTYASNSSGDVANFEFRNIAIIPDRNINDSNHKMFYLPVLCSDGRTWLNNNLGALYSSYASSFFSPSTAAGSSTDYKAYGSLFQWGRKADSHEIYPSTGPTTTIKSDVPLDNKFIITGVQSGDWRVNPDSTLWNGEAAVNNPCPLGYRVPTINEWNTLISANNITNAASAYSSPLKLTIEGGRNNTGTLIFTGLTGYYWSSTVNNLVSSVLLFDTSGAVATTSGRTFGYNVRCIRD